jgi:hypothetical protein
MRHTRNHDQLTIPEELPDFTGLSALPLRKQGQGHVESGYGHA